MTPADLPVRPCIGCGYCCKKAACSAAWALNRTNDKNECLELVYKDGRYWCGLVLNPPDHDADWWKNQLHVGAGCCCGLNSDRARLLEKNNEASK